MLDKLKAAGFNWLAFGIEAGADRVRADVDKAFDQDEVFRVIEQVRAAGINVIGNYIFGLPEDDLDTMQATLDLAVDLNCEFANFYSAMAYPGSPLYDAGRAAGRAAAGDVDRLLAALARLPAAADAPPAGARGAALPRRGVPALLHATRAIWTWSARRFGPETVEHIRQMTAYRLERDLLDGHGRDRSAAGEDRGRHHLSCAWTDSSGAASTSTRLKLRSL